MSKAFKVFMWHIKNKCIFYWFLELVELELVWGDKNSFPRFIVDSSTEANLANRADVQLKWQIVVFIVLNIERA